MSPESRPDFLARSVAGLAAWVARHPRAVLLAAAVLTAASVHAAYDRLEYRTQRNDLLSPDKPCQKRWQRYVDTFGDEDDMVVVAEGSDRARMTAALDSVAERVRQRPDLFDRVFYKVDLRHLRDRALLHLPFEQLEAILRRVERMEPLLGAGGPVAWRMLSAQSLLASAAVALEGRAAGREPSAADRDLLAQLPAVAASAADTLRDPAAYRNPWSLTGPTPPAPADDPLAAPRYFFTPDGSLAMLTCRPRKAAESFTPAKEANAAMRAILAEVGPEFPGVALGLTGLPVLETDEMALSDVDSTRASWLALSGVAALYFIVYRGFRYPLLTLTTLVVGTVWALGWATVTVGHLNILSATFAVMLIGLGDYGPLWVAQYDHARRHGEGVAGAMRHAARTAGPSVLTAAATTALAFFAVTLADFKAVAELGWIAGCGILLCAASCLLLMPALLVLADSGVRRRDSGVRRQGTGDREEPSSVFLTPDSCPLTPELSPVSRFLSPGWVLAAGAALVVAVGAFGARLGYDHNLLHLQARGLDSVRWERKLIDRAAGATWDSLSVARTRDEALALKAKYEAIPEVGHVVEVASLLPADQERKLPVVRAIRDRLAGLPPADERPAPLGSDPAAVRELAAKVARLATGDAALARAADRLAAAVERCPSAADRLRQFDRRLAADLSAELHQLKAVCRPAPVTADDVPPELRERYVGANGEYLVRAFARDSLWDYHALRKFTVAAAAADPEATGKAFRTLEGLRQMEVGFERAALYALAAIALVLLLDLRRLADLALGLLPLAAGVVLTFGVMGAVGLPLNPANTIALPLIVGVGVYHGIHVMHDSRNGGRPAGSAYRLGAATGRGVMITGLTTLIGFGTLVSARHRGMASLGLVLALGVAFCMLAGLVLLPAAVRLRDLRRLRRDRAAKPEPAVPPLPARRAA